MFKVRSSDGANFGVGSGATFILRPPDGAIPAPAHSPQAWLTASRFRVPRRSLRRGGHQAGGCCIATLHVSARGPRPHMATRQRRSSGARYSKGANQKKGQSKSPEQSKTNDLEVWSQSFVSEFEGRSMSKISRGFLIAIMLPVTLDGCGLYVPEKNPLAPDTLDNNNLSSGGKYEDMIVRNIFCETAVGLKKAYDLVKAQDPELVKLPWLKDWGTAITLAITAEDQSGLSPGLSLTTPFANEVFKFPSGNVISPQSFSFGIGGSATASATRAETIQFTYTNVGLLRAGEKFLEEEPKFDPEHPDFDDACKTYQSGVMIESDLKIWEFTYDKAIIAANGNAAAYVPVEVKTGSKLVNGKMVPEYKTVGYTKHPSWPLYNTFTANITFTATFGGNVTPTWKLARISANTSGNLLSATRTNTNQLTITLGPIQTQPSATAATQLSSGAQTQHDNTVLSNQIKTPNN
jgi:hypothetical protein